MRKEDGLKFNGLAIYLKKLVNNNGINSKKVEEGKRKNKGRK